MIKKVLLLTCCALFSAQSVSASELWDFYENYSDDYKANTDTIENVSHRIVEVLTSKQSEEDIKKALLFQTGSCLPPEVNPRDVLQEGIAALNQLGNGHGSTKLALLKSAGLAAFNQIPKDNPWRRFNLLSILANAAQIYENEYVDESDQEELISQPVQEEPVEEVCVQSSSSGKNSPKNSSSGSSDGKNSTSGNSNGSGSPHRGKIENLLKKSPSKP